MAMGLGSVLPRIIGNCADRSISDRICLVDGIAAAQLLLLQASLF